MRYYLHSKHKVNLYSKNTSLLNKTILFKGTPMLRNPRLLGHRKIGVEGVWDSGKAEDRSKKTDDRSQTPDVR